MHLESLRAQTASVDGTPVTFAAGERIWTESSYKYEPGQIVELCAQAGFAMAEQWIDEGSRFALTLLTAF
jgi:uncharacterized SAM-dependent methyltransferase